ncbi:DUF2637 domain-containing protein [Dactylosporangium sp. NPDC005555]|uniref:DUF2637 domain-containing protein n=1 Tax=Dactylosporangium sp. NPDC005555 TaxID=3154889 RepID=UPI0033A5B974
MTRQRDGWVVAGMLIAATSAAVASFTGLRGLAMLSGWPERLAILLPVTIDAYAMTAARVWLSGTNPKRAVRFARANAIGAITTSIVGNAAYHAAAADLITVTWPVVVAVGAVPAAVLGLTAHLHAVRTVEDPPEPGPAPSPAQKPTVRTEDELLAAARDADAQHRAANNGRPITRDALRTTLRISGPRATALRRQLADASQAPERKEAHTN